MDVFKLEMSQQMSVALARNNLCYVEEILLITPEALSKKLGIDLRICREFLDKIRLEILPRPIENSNSEILLTGLQGLDELGGIAKGQLFEVFGEAGCNCSVLIVAGKTNFALSCAMHVALPREYGGNDGIVVYICTDHAFPINRFMTLLKCFKDENPEFSTEEILERVLVQELSVRDLVDFERILLHVIPALLDMLPNVKLIVIDSIAYNFRSEQESAVDRAAKLVEIANVLKSCCARYDLGVLLINQVTDNFDHDIFCTTSVAHGPSHWIKISLDNFDLSKRPALGLAWSNCVNTRCMKSI